MLQWNTPTTGRWTAGNRDTGVYAAITKRPRTGDYTWVLAVQGKMVGGGNAPTIKEAKAAVKLARFNLT